ncbi:Solute-binding transport lipoprotein OS=Streptomyces microflavus OX=1919 GN=Smic_06730 PE=3 SV=1 [Streptomyces microflavus]
MFYRASLQAAAALASLSLLAGCGLLSDSGSEENQKIAVGTTSSPSTLDPAAAWDGSWELMRNIYQTLVSFPTGSTSPEPDAADTCTFTDATSMAYRCTLKKNLKFSNGEKLDAEAVKYSIDRIVDIHFKGGPAGMLGSLDRIETKGDDTVIFHLNKSDATFPFILATPAMSLVAPGDFAKDKIRDDGKVTGSGPYLLDSYEAGVTAELTQWWSSRRRPRTPS